MPVTARLSRKLYDKLGDDVANELVEWFNSVDATYRSDLRELNELNFARFDAKLEQRLSEFRAELRIELAQQLAQLRLELVERIAASEKSVLRWMFVFWIGSWATMVGTLVALRHLGFFAAP